ncbi:MAG: hypothetical protein JWP80_877 [Pseudomonas sp.]|nr:hypothetical protein [Pseudomonas sp.]
MIISNAVGVKANLVATPQPSAALPNMEPKAASTPIKPEILNSNVSISGQALLKQRIFDGAEPRYRPLSETNTPGSMYLRITDFVTREDCQLLSDIYEFAQEGGADLKYVDNLGFSLADYRSNDNGRNMGPHGSTLDAEGRLISVSFLDKDVATIQRILASDALKTTRLDQGFIRFKTDASYSATDFNRFEFMEQVINKFSAKGAGVPPLDARFSRYEYSKKTYNMHFSTEKYELGPKGRVRKRTAATNTNDPSAALNKKKNALKTKPTTPESIQDMFRRIMAKAWGSGFGLRVRSLAEFLMRSGR